MTAISKMTKAQLMQQVEELEMMLDKAEQEVASYQPTPFTERLATVRDEVIAFGRDVYRFGAWCRKGFDRVLTELRTLGYK